MHHWNPGRPVRPLIRFYLNECITMRRTEPSYSNTIEKGCLKSEWENIFVVYQNISFYFNEEFRLDPFKILVLLLLTNGVNFLDKNNLFQKHSVKPSKKGWFYTQANYFLKFLKKVLQISKLKIRLMNSLTSAVCNMSQGSNLYGWMLLPLSEISLHFVGAGKQVPKWAIFVIN